VAPATPTSRFVQFFNYVFAEYVQLAKDRAYRIAVKKQHRYVEKAGEWFENTAPVRYLSPLWKSYGLNDSQVIMERHQRRAEDIKAFLRSSFNSTAYATASSSFHTLTSFALVKWSQICL
jgi:hypothetical protein